MGDGAQARVPLARWRTDHVIMVALGFLWVVDGILQLQPASFTKTFTDSILSPNLAGQPSPLSSAIGAGVQLFNASPWAANLGAALIQVLIGISLILPLSRRFKVLALLVSVGWSLVVWVVGEGMGNILTGSATFYTGAPGSVLLYLVLAVFLLYPQKLPARRLPTVAGGLFLFGAALQMLPTFWSSDGVQSVFSLAASDAISAVSAPATSLANLASGSPIMSNVILIAALLAFGLLLVLRPGRTLAIATGGFLLLIWWLGQDFGGIFTFPTSTATDPNSAVVFLLFLAPLIVGGGAALRSASPLGAELPS